MSQESDRTDGTACSVVQAVAVLMSPDTGLGIVRQYYTMQISGSDTFISLDGRTVTDL